MFKEIRKIFPTDKEYHKEKLETVPTDKEMKKELQTSQIYESLLDGCIEPITFFDMVEHEPKALSVIMSLPLEIQGKDNFDVYRHNNMFSNLSNADLYYLHQGNVMVQTENVYGMIVDAMVSNYQIFAYNAPALNYMIDRNHDVRKNIADEFGYHVFNDVQSCMYPLRSRIDSLYNHDTYSILAVDATSLKIDDRDIERTISILNATSKQINDMVMYVICAFTNQYLHEFIMNSSDQDIAYNISCIKQNVDINNTLKLDTRVELRSFLSEFIRSDLKILFENNIRPCINHICDNAGITSYFVYKDMIKERNQNKE